MPEAQTLAPPASEERVEIGVVRRELQIRADSFNEEDRTVDVVFTTGARRTMFSWARWDYVDEELSTDAKAVRMDRINAGGPVLNSHRSGNLADQIGVVVDGSARMEKGVGVATIRLSAREDIAGIVQDIRDGIIRNISVGYMVHQYDITEREGQRPLYRAVDWEPAEISFVPIPADAGAGTRGAEPEQGGFPCILSRAASAPPAHQEVRMTTPNEPNAGPEAPVVTTAPEQRANPTAAAPAALTATLIRTLAGNAKLPAETVLKLMARHDEEPFTHETLVAEIGKRWAEQGSTAAPQVNGARVTVDERDKVRDALTGAIEHRTGVRKDLPAGAELFRNLSLVEMGRELARRAGETAIAQRDPMAVAGWLVRSGGMHTTSDFPLILANVAGKSLRQAYEAAPKSFTDFVRVVEVADFKPQSFAALGDAPTLLAISEAGEIQSGTIGEDAESLQLQPYGRIINVSRRMIVNDDLDAFSRIPVAFGRRAAELEGDLVVTGVLVGNPSLRTGGALFQNAAARGNNLAAAGSAITVAALNAGRATMRKQTGINGGRINIAPSFLVVGPDKETEAQQLVSTVLLPNQSSAINPFAGQLQVRVDPRITGNLWFLISDPSMCDTIALAYLRGRVGPVIEEAMEFDVDGTKIRCITDLAAAALDFRGMYRNPGA